ncbi:MAG: MJ0042-type zinc finger domain-containing protein [Candidatus Thorarchaeota archaeon]
MPHQAEKFYLSCPNCQARYMYHSEYINPDGSVACQNCNLLMKVAEESQETFLIEDVVVKPIFSKRFVYGFATMMLLLFTIFLLMHSTLDLEPIIPPGWVLLPIEPP